MVKLFTDEEVIKKCRDFQPIPLSIEQDVLHYDGDPDRVSILNGVKESPYKIGQPVANVNMFATQLPYNIPIRPEQFLEKYNEVLDKKIKSEVTQVMNQLLEKIEMDEDIIADIESVADTASTRAVPPQEEEQDLTGTTMKIKVPKRTKEQRDDYFKRRAERLQMREEDKPEQRDTLTRAEVAQQIRRGRSTDELGREESKGEL